MQYAGNSLAPSLLFGKSITLNARQIGVSFTLIVSPTFTSLLGFASRPFSLTFSLSHACAANDRVLNSLMLQIYLSIRTAQNYDSSPYSGKIQAVLDTSENFKFETHSFQFEFHTEIL
jgi:hypothetical protein